MRLVALSVGIWLGLACAAGAQVAEAPARPVAPHWQAVTDGVELAVFDAASITGEPGPVAVHAVRLDLSRMRVELALARDTSPALERVDAMAARHGAIAAVNAGFFLPRGRPAGLLKMDGRLVAPGPNHRAAIGLAARPRAPVSIDRVTPTLTAALGWGHVWPGAWFLTGGATSPLDWLTAEDAIGGAGLILSGGVEVDGWAAERVRDDFVTTRHPRTLAALDGDGRLWLLAIDGRQPGHSLGASFPALVALSRHLGFVDVVNLDGGGSTTMVVQGRIVNKPSDLTGPRAVSDALIVVPR